MYNTAAYVGSAVRSLRDQTLGSFEAIVVDDGSTDESAARARDAAGDDPRFRFLSQKNKGLSAARNAGLAEARAEVIGFLDSDDRLAPRFLETLLQAMDKTGAPWATSAVRIVHPDGEHIASAIHGIAAEARPGMRELSLKDWREIVPIWPSAWNKLYSRDLIAGLEFVEGLQYEDHPWFQRIASRSDTIAYIPEPLYLHTQGRKGQITQDGSERVFEQFDVLDHCAKIIRGSQKPGKEQGLARIASRLIHERSEVVADPARRARFARASKEFLSAHRIAWTTEWDRGIARSFGRVMAGQMPVTVVVPVAEPGQPLTNTLSSLRKQRLRDLEVLVVQSAPDVAARHALARAVEAMPTASFLAAGVIDGDGDIAAARNRGLVASRGLYTVFLDPGDTLLSGALWTWVEGMLREQADFGVSRFREGTSSGEVSSGCYVGSSPFGVRFPPVPEIGQQPPDWVAEMEGTAAALSPDRVVALRASPSAKIFRTEFLREAGLAFPDGPFSSWDLVVRAGLFAKRVLAIPSASVVISSLGGRCEVPAAPLRPAEIREALLRLSPLLDPVLGRAGWYPRLLARAMWDQANRSEDASSSEGAAFLENARPIAAQAVRDHPSAEIDPHVGEAVRILFGMGVQSAEKASSLR